MESSRSNNKGEEEVYTEVRSTFVRAYVYDTLTQDYYETARFLFFSDQNSFSFGDAYE